MNVWVVVGMGTVNNADAVAVIGVYSTRERAEAIADIERREPVGYGSVEVDEVTVDAWRTWVAVEDVTP